MYATAAQQTKLTSMTANWPPIFPWDTNFLLPEDRVEHTLADASKQERPSKSKINALLKDCGQQESTFQVLVSHTKTVRQKEITTVTMTCGQKRKATIHDPIPTTDSDKAARNEEATAEVSKRGLDEDLAAQDFYLCGSGLTKKTTDEGHGELYLDCENGTLHFQLDEHDEGSQKRVVEVVDLSEPLRERSRKKGVSIMTDCMQSKSSTSSVRSPAS